MSSADDFKPDKVQTIQLRTDALHEIASEAEAALIAAGAPVYARGGEIVRPIIEEVAAFNGRRTKIARLRSFTVDMLRDHLSRAARWEKYDGRCRKVVPTNPSIELAKTILARDGDWQFRHLTGIITTPTLRSNGSILAQPGYDQNTGLLLVDPPSMPPIPAKPSRDDALTALTLVDDLLAEFPFVSDADRSVALSALMTPVIRGAMQVAPMHAVTSPEAGTGKSYIVDLASALAIGEIAPVIAAGRNEEETEKRLSAELMTAQPIVSIDNLNGDLGGDFMCQAIERPMVKPRVLGRSENRRIDNTVTLYGNGNNMRLIGDISRRALLCSLDANLERPELRRFRGNPVATVLADRGRYIAAILTIVRAYLAADCPHSCSPLASFNDWSQVVRSPLIWLGHTDPVQTMEAVRADNPSITNLRAFVAAWREVIGSNIAMTAGELRDKALSSIDCDMLLNRAMLTIASPHGRNEIDVLRLAKWLSRNRGRIVDGLKIVSEYDKHTKQQKWQLINTR